jgi:hypothetical protein
MSYEIEFSTSDAIFRRRAAAVAAGLPARNNPFASPR